MRQFYGKIKNDKSTQFKHKFFKSSIKIKYNFYFSKRNCIIKLLISLLRFKKDTLNNIYIYIVYLFNLSGS